MVQLGHYEVVDRQQPLMIGGAKSIKNRNKLFLFFLILRTWWHCDDFSPFFSLYSACCRFSVARICYLLANHAFHLSQFSAWNAFKWNAAEKEHEVSQLMQFCMKCLSNRTSVEKKPITNLRICWSKLWILTKKKKIEFNQKCLQLI